MTKWSGLGDSTKLPRMRLSHWPYRTAPAQRQGWPHSAGWSNSIGIWFPGGVRGPVRRGFALDLGAHDRTGRLMIQLGGAGAAPWGESGLERGGDSPEGASSPRAMRTRGVSSLRARRRFRGVAPGPRARWRFARGMPGAGCLLGRWDFLGRGMIKLVLFLWFQCTRIHKTKKTT
jgi:hypothetical protein